MPKVLLATGGTGGHIFPAAALASQLESEGIEVLYAGAKLSVNPFFHKEKCVYADVRSGKGIKDVFHIGQGVLDSVKVIRSFSPDVIVGFGSYYSFPVLAAGSLTRCPLVLWAADSVPGKVIRWFSPLSVFTGIQFPEAANRLKGKTCLCKMPLRQGYQKGAVSRQAALRYYGLEGKKPVCLIFGGSQGASFMNQIAPVSLGAFEVIHLSGNSEETQRLKARYSSLGVSAAVKDFEPQMNQAWSAADVACVRSGAVSTAEQLEFEVPALLIPFPSATDNHQEKNADFIVSLNMAIKILEKNATPQVISKALLDLYQTRSQRALQLQTFKQNNPVKTLKELVMEIL